MKWMCDRGGVVNRYMNTMLDLNIRGSDQI